MELRNDLSNVLRKDVEEQKLRIQNVKVSSSVRKGETELVDGDVAASRMDPDLADWLGDCVDADTIEEVCEH